MLGALTIHRPVPLQIYCSVHVPIAKIKKIEVIAMNK